MKRKIFLSFLVLVHFVVTGFAQDNPPNIIVFLVDDLRPELGCYGSRLAKSPNVDALAKDGVLFQKAYAQQAICAPSRMSILTGLRPETIGIYSLFTPLRSKHKDMVTMPQFFKERGYTTVSLGKVYHYATDDKGSWSMLFPKEKNAWIKPESLAIIDSLKKGGVEGNGPAYECADVKDEAYEDGRVANKAIETLHQLKDKKFMMVVGLSKPHLPFNAPKKYWDLYNQKDLQVPLREAPKDIYRSSLTNWGELRTYHGIPKEGDLDDETSKNLIHGYLACVSYMDAQMGKVMKALDDLDLRKNTMVVFMSDHGYKIGEYGAWCKHTNFEIDVNVPLIISRETGFKQRVTNAKTNALVENVDLFPTLADASGFKTHPLEGTSLLPFAANPTMKGESGAYSVYPRGKNIMGFTCTDGVFRYTVWWDNRAQQMIEEELFLCKQNFMQPSANLAKDAKYKKQVQRMDELLERQFPKDKRSFYPQNDSSKDASTTSQN